MKKGKRRAERETEIIINEEIDIPESIKSPVGRKI